MAHLSVERRTDFHNSQVLDEISLCEIHGA
jgi:hypothetical protein